MTNSTPADGLNGWGSSSSDVQDEKIRTSVSAPISKLPAELLCVIFRMNRPYTLPYPEERAGLSIEEHFQIALGWVVVSWVCRYWRSLALNDSTLWIVLPVTFSTWTTVMLERSQKAGLIVDLHAFSCSARCREIILPHILANGSRVAQLKLCAEKTDDMPKLLAHFSSTPKLSTLKISQRGVSYSSPGIDLPNDVFCNTVRLRHLDLDGFNINWESHLLYNPLHTLILAGISLSTRPTFAELRSIFKNLSSTLKVLRLRHALPIPNPMDPNTDSTFLNNLPISLPLLEQMELGAGPDQLRLFLNNISPGDQIQDFQITTTFNYPSRPAFVSFVDILYRHQFLAQSLATVQCLLLCSFAGCVDFAASNTSHFGHQLSSSSETSTNKLICRFRINLHQMTSSQEAEITPSIIEDVFHALHWTNLHDLQIYFEEANETSHRLDNVLRSTFGALVTLETLRLVGVTSTRYVIKALRTDSGATSADSDSTAAIPFPGLKEIFIRHASFHSSHLRTEKKTLRRVVKDRFKLGIPIVKIALTASPGLDKKDVESLGRYVADVDLDGYEEAGLSEHDDDLEEEDEMSSEAD